MLVVSRRIMLFSLCFFVAMAVHCAAEFSVPFIWDYSGGSQTMAMKNPSFVGLQKCEVEQFDDIDFVTIKDCDGADLLCAVSGGFIVKGGDLLSMDYRGEVVCEVRFGEKGYAQNCLEFIDEKQNATFYDLGSFEPFTNQKKRRYVVGVESLTVKSFLGKADGVGELFVSATIFYKDLKNFVIRYGKVERFRCRRPRRTLFC